MKKPVVELDLLRLRGKARREARIVDLMLGRPPPARVGGEKRPADRHMPPAHRTGP